MKLALTLEADSVNVQALNMGRIVVDIDGVNLAERKRKLTAVCSHQTRIGNLDVRIFMKGDHSITSIEIG